MARGIFYRMADIVKANVNDLVTRAEDPDKKMIRQMDSGNGRSRQQSHRLGRHGCCQ